MIKKLIKRIKVRYFLRECFKYDCPDCPYFVDNGERMDECILVVALGLLNEDFRGKPPFYD